MAKFACPICGDPNAYPCWIDDDPPSGCPSDESWMQGKLRAVNSVTECGPQMRKARQRAEWRKAAPDCFDGDGNMLPGKIGEVLERWAEANPGQPVVL